MIAAHRAGLYKKKTQVNSHQPGSYYFVDIRRPILLAAQAPIGAVALQGGLAELFEFWGDLVGVAI